MIKKILSILILLVLSLGISGYRKPDVFKIDAEKNAYMHNNLGLKAVSESQYNAAIQEFNIAISLNPKSQATAVYYNNLGETYMKIAYYKYAQTCFENAITQYNLNFLYYKNLVASFAALNIIPAKIKYYETCDNKNPMNMIMLGLLYTANKDIRRGIIKLDEFCMREPDLIITSAVKSYIASIIPAN